MACDGTLAKIVFLEINILPSSFIMEKSRENHFQTGPSKIAVSGKLKRDQGSRAHIDSTIKYQLRNFHS